MSRTVVILQGHPDPAGGHLCHGLADAYAEGAAAAGHRVLRVEIARIDVPILRDRAAFETGELPASLAEAKDAIVAADHVVLVFPLWLGTMPALVKAFLEQVMRPGVAFAYEKTGIRKLLTGRSAHIVVTMGMPALAYRLFFLSHGVAGLRRNIFKFVGLSPVRGTMFGMVMAASERTRQGWLARMRRDGERLR
jgi:putative NADPH-quinone reductase